MWSDTVMQRFPSILTAGALLVAGCGASTTASEATSRTTTPATTTATTTTPAPATTGVARAADGSTLAGVNSVAWPANVTVTVDEAAGTWRITSDGLPSHGRPSQYLVPEPGANVATVTLDILQLGGDPTVASPTTWTLPLKPVKAAAPTTLFGPVAIADSGAMINDPYEGDRKTIALEGNFVIDGVGFIDTCNGHPNPMGQYHYHGIPVCVTAEIDQPGEHSHIAGFAADGFPVYGPQDTDGAAPTDLDICSGHTGSTPEFPDGIYHYHLLEVFPYSLICLSGTQAESTKMSGMNHRGPPPGGPPAGGDQGPPSTPTP